MYVWIDINRYDAIIVHWQCFPFNFFFFFFGLTLDRFQLNLSGDLNVPIYQWCSVFLAPIWSRKFDVSLNETHKWNLSVHFYDCLLQVHFAYKTCQFHRLLHRTWYPPSLGGIPPGNTSFIEFAYVKVIFLVTDSVKVFFLNVVWMSNFLKKRYWGNPNNRS